MRQRLLTFSLLCLFVTLPLTVFAQADADPLEAQFNAMWTDKELGYSFENGKSVFRLFVPRGVKVETVIFDKHDDAIEKARIVPMKNDGKQVFEAFVDGTLWGKYYGYRIVERSYVPKAFKPAIAFDTVFADPYSRATAQSNTFPQKSRSLIIDTSKYDWQGDKSLGINLGNAVIMEAHVRDLTASPTAEASVAGFKGLVDAKKGGLKWLKNLGVTAVEFLPIQDFANKEPPYGQTGFGFKNTWNVYAENYWGYMTSNFFAPESYFASDGTRDPARWNGTDGRAINEFRDVVKAAHSMGISVLMDVVYNHVADYDEGALKLIDWEFYFKKVEHTGCGNEVQSRRPMVRRLMTDSMKYWIKEYHVDGYRMDLATSYDKDTVAAMIKAVQSVNPKAQLIAEPWGGEGAVSPSEFLRNGWAKWNSGIRSDIRGENRPTKGGTIFANGTGASAMEMFGYWSGDAEGFKSWQLVNYIESHDDATLGDNLRIQSGTYNFFKDDGSTINRIADLVKYTKLTPELDKAHKVAAVALYLAQGPIMLHIGQEWARGKVTPDLKGKTSELISGGLGGSSDAVVIGTPTPNSYSADNETNWIDFKLAEVNRNLIDYYTGLNKLRIKEPLLGSAPTDKILTFQGSVENSAGVAISERVYGFINIDATGEAAVFEIPEGTYGVYADADKASDKPLRTFKGSKVTVPAATPLILIRQK